MEKKKLPQFTGEIDVYILLTIRYFHFINILFNLQFKFFVVNNIPKANPHH